MATVDVDTLGMCMETPTAIETSALLEAATDEGVQMLDRQLGEAPKN